MKNRLFDVMMPLLPKNDLSHLVGRIVHRRIPGVLGRKSVEWFAKYYRINLDEAEFPIEQYPSIGELFIRRLKAGVRPVGTGVVHCADAVISEGGKIENQTLIQAKGKLYTVSELLKSSKDADAFEGGQFATYYLCPTDYHRVHSPVDGEIVSSTHVPGELWPVNAWSVNKIETLFGVNERVVVMIDTPQGKVALVMVAATNVGNMSMTFDTSISTELRAGDRLPNERIYKPAIKVGRGEEVGIFHMGSTVVMLFAKGVVAADLSNYRGQSTKVGASIL